MYRDLLCYALLKQVLQVSYLETNSCHQEKLQ